MEEIFFYIIIALVIFIIGNTIGKNQSNVEKDFLLNDDLVNKEEITNEKEIIILLKNIAENQRKIRTNTTIIATIMLIPIIISIIILLLSITIINNIFQGII